MQPASGPWAQLLRALREVSTLPNGVALLEGSDGATPALSPLPPYSWVTSDDSGEVFFSETIGLILLGS